MISIIKREWLRLKKQPKLIVTTFLMPCVLIFLVMGVYFSGVLKGKPQKIAVVTDSPEVQKFLEVNGIYEDPEPNESFGSYENLVVYEARNEELEKQFDKGKIGLIIDIDCNLNTVQFEYDSTKLSSEETIVTAQEFVSDLSLFLQSEEVYEDFVEIQQKVLEEKAAEVETEEDQKAKLEWIISILVAILIFMAGQPLASFAVDSYVGEKERGTYDSIRLSGVEISQFIMGKTLFTLGVGLLSSLLQIGTVFFGLVYFEGSLGVENYIDQGLMMTVTIALTGCISLAMLVAVLIYLSTYFEKVRDAGTYASIGILVFTLLSQVSHVVEDPVIEYIPLLNMNQLILENAHGAVGVMPLVVSVGLGVAVVIIIMQMSVLKLKRKEM